VPPSQIKLATHAAGRVIVAWDDRRAETPAVHIAWADAQDGRLTPEATAPAGTSPALAAAAGSAVVAWLDADTVRVRTLGGGRMAQR
jgi:hypothetical protein